MNELILALNILSALPQPRAAAAAPPAAEVRTGTLIACACRPGEMVALRPGALVSMADERGIATFIATAQDHRDPPFEVETEAGRQKVNGWVTPGQILSTTCP